MYGGKKRGGEKEIQIHPGHDILVCYPVSSSKTHTKWNMNTPKSEKCREMTGREFYICLMGDGISRVGGRGANTGRFGLAL